MKILLTGGSGFIGKNILESFLAERHEIKAPRRNELDCVDDKSVERFFTKNSFDAIIHSAAKPSHRNAPDTNGILYSNSRMTVNLLKYHDSWGKLINMGSGSVYDMEHYVPKMKEEYAGAHIPKDETGYNKYFGSLLFPHYRGAVDFRIFGIFGKYEDYAIRFISNAICKTLFDIPITIRQNRKFDYLFIDDLMPILDHFIQQDPKHSAYNITPDTSVELLQIARIVNDIAGNKHEIRVGQSGFGTEYSGDNARLKLELRNVKFASLEEAIGKLYAWYERNKEWLDKNKLLIDK